MGIEQLAYELRKMYDTAPRGEQVTHIHLLLERQLVSYPLLQRATASRSNS